MHIPPFIFARILAFIAGIVIYYFASHHSARTKKDRISSFLSLLARFVILMFLMKFVTKFPMVFEYPFALLAYPSGTFEFYLALLVILFIYRNEYKKTKDKGSFHYDMFLLAAGSSFFYYFTIITLYSEDVFIEIGLWFFLFVSSVIFKKYWHEILLVGIATASVLSIVVEVPAIMGIRVHMAFYLLLTMLLFILLIKKWRGSKWAQT